MRFALLQLINPDLLTMVGVFGLVFTLQAFLVHAGARMAGFEGGARWAVWSLSATWTLTLVGGYVAEQKDVVIPFWYWLAGELAVLTVALRLNYFNARLVRAGVVAAAAIALTIAASLATAYGIEKLVEHFDG